MINKFKKSIRFEILTVYVVCIVVSVFAGKIAENTVQLSNDNISASHIFIMKNLNSPAVNLSKEIEQKKIHISDKPQIKKLLNDFNDQDYDIIISDSSGKVLYNTDETSQTQVDINDTVKSFIDMTMGEKLLINSKKEGNEYTSFYPVRFSDDEGFIIINNKLTRKVILGDKFLNDKLILTIVVFITFVIMFILLTNKKVRYIEYISLGLLEISKGDLNYKIKLQGEDELTLLASNINLMSEELQKQIENERNAEKIKNELIANVSHDLRTPLTSIKGYLEIIKSKKDYNQVQFEQYIDIVYNKSEKLETLINNLFEYTKLTNNAVSVEYQNIDLNQLLSQLIEEFVPICESNNVTITKKLIKEKIFLKLDPNKTVRIFENLLSNAIKYSIKPSDIKVDLEQEDNIVAVSIKNRCEAIDAKDLEKIFERFYRIDKSRSSATGGSGLGLAIAKNLVEIQGGVIEVVNEANYITFIVKFKTERA